MRKGVRGRWSRLSGDFMSASSRGGTVSTRCSLMARNWLNFSGMLLRAGGTLMCTRRSVASMRSNWPLLRLLFKPRISQASGPRWTSGCG